ncbi:MAG: hypothetical protein ACRDID_10950 [Ktedonobacterales bacterium]
MERLNKTLIWLAAVVLALGLVMALLFASPAFELSAPRGYFFYTSQDGFLGSYFTLLSSQTANLLLGLSTLLNGGAITLAAALAFLNRRWGWLIALIVVTLLTLLWPPFALVWFNSSPPTGLTSQIGVYNFTTLAVRLIPVALALIFALIRRRPASTATETVV